VASLRGGASLATFFVPDTPAGEQTDRAYEDLRQYAEYTAGLPPRSRRIFSISCRRDGSDSESRVGDTDPAGGDTVHAIFDTGKSYVIVWRGGHAIVTKRHTYEAVEFE
jgi:hypothetical protein